VVINGIMAKAKLRASMVELGSLFPKNRCDGSVDLGYCAGCAHHE